MGGLVMGQEQRVLGFGANLVTMHHDGIYFVGLVWLWVMGK